MHILEVNHLYKKFNQQVAVNDLSFHINPGEIYGLLGPNGAGKSTTIHIITGLITKNAGEVLVKGQDIDRNARACKKIIGVVPQELAIYEDLTAWDNLRFFGSLYGIKGDALKESIRDTLSFIGLESHGKKRVSTFSGGMKRRLNIGCALVATPELIIMDEPTVGIDPQSRSHILGAVKSLKENGRSVLYTTHYMEEAEKLCDRLSIIDNGNVAAEGTVEELEGLISEENILEIELKNEDLIDLKHLQQMDEVANIRQVESKIIIHKSDKKVSNNQIARYFIDQDIEINGIGTKKVNLEDVFLSITGKTLRD